MKNYIKSKLSLRTGALALLTVAALLGSTQPSVAQTPSLDVYYDRLDPKTTFKYKFKGVEGVCNVGAFRWEVPASSFSTGGLDRNFTGYCAEIEVTIVAGKTYRFQQTSLLDPKYYGLKPDAEGIRAAQRRATYIRELFGRHYSEGKTGEPKDTFAFQIALWELTHETEPADRVATFDLFSGDFQANYTKETAPDYVLQAQAWLQELTGNDASYYENPNIKGRELVRLDGIPNADGLTAQSQYALRYINGGAPRTAPGGGLLGTTGSVSGAGGFAAGGTGGFATVGTIGNGGDTGGPGGGPLVSLGDIGTSGTSGTTGTTGGPPTTTNQRPPANGPQTTPVPAPAGLILGLVAVGAIASRRVYSRLTNR
jgi:hypothetical protein